jgi:hypothetical protein
MNDSCNNTRQSSTTRQVKGESNLLVHVKLSEDLGCVQQMLVVEDPKQPCQNSPLYPPRRCSNFGDMIKNILLSVESEERQVKQDR